MYFLEESSFLLRVVRLYQETLFLQILCFLLVDEHKHAVFSRVFAVFWVFLAIFAVFSLIFTIKSEKVLLSSAILCVNFCSVAAAVRVFAEIRAFFARELAESFEDAGFLQELAATEMRSRKVQVFALVLGHSFSAAGLFLQDLLGKQLGEGIDCFSGILGGLAHVWAVFYVFYWRNRGGFCEKDQGNYEEMERS